MVVWSDVARNDLRAIHDYIALDSELYAKKTVRDIVERGSTLQSMPERGRVVPELNDPHVREIFVYSYRVIYQISSAGVEVLTVIHDHRDFSGEDIPLPSE